MSNAQLYIVLGVQTFGILLGIFVQFRQFESLRSDMMARFNAMEINMNARFLAIDQKFIAIDQRFDEIHRDLKDIHRVLGEHTAEIAHLKQDA